MTLNEVQQKVTSSEFSLWKARFHQEWNEHTKLDHYLAQIAHTIALVNAKEGASIPAEVFFPKFKREGEEEEIKIPNINATKATWGLRLRLPVK